MGKNIIVVDEQGNEYEATYPKRAKGLVKNGRARFVDENKICLACPPENMEECDMTEEIKNKNVVAVEEKVTETKAMEYASKSEKYNMDYVLTQIESICNNTEYLNRIATELVKIEVEAPQPGAPDDLANQARAQALGDIVRCRETTNQQLLRFYEKVYDDLRHFTVETLDDNVLKNERGTADGIQTAHIE